MFRAFGFVQFTVFVLILSSIISEVTASEIENTQEGGAAEAIFAITSSIIDLKANSTQIELGSGVFVNLNRISANATFKSRLFFQQNYTAFAKFNLQALDHRDGDVVFYGGLGGGMKWFKPATGRFYTEFMVGGAAVQGGGGRMLLEPSIMFPVVQSKQVKTFFLKHSIGLNASIACTFYVNPDDPLRVDELNAVRFDMNFFLNRKHR